MKKFKSMDCPVCGQFYFSGPSKYLSPEEIEEELQDFAEGRVQCTHCGWIYDLGQTENPDSREGHNPKSLNEHRKWFKAKVEENPDYDWWEENKPAPTPHKCPVCGEFEFEDEGSHEICPICGWQDDGMDEIDPDSWSACGMSYNEALANFKAKRAADPNYRRGKSKR